MWEDYAFGLSTAFSKEYGEFDGQKKYHSKNFKRSRNQIKSELWGMMRISDNGTAFFQMPYLMSFQKNSAKFDYGYGIGDLLLGYRYQIVDIGEYVELPGIALTTSLVFPTGKSALSPNLSNQLDAIGRGIFWAQVAMSFEKTYLPWFIQVNLATKLPLPAQKDASSPVEWAGVSLQGNAAIGRTLTKNLTLTMLTTYSYESEMHLDHRSIANSSKYKLNFALACAWTYDPQISFQGSLLADLPLSSLGKQCPALVAGSIGVRYGIA